MTVGLYKLGGASASCLKCDNKNCILPMTFKGNFDNDHYYKSGNRASWARRSKSLGGQNHGKKNAQRIGVNRLGGNKN